MAINRSISLSHAHLDNAVCSQYAEALRRRGIEVWLDLTDAQKGYDLSVDIASQLKQRSVFVLMVTSASNDSHWVQMELDIYIALRNDKPTHMLNGVERMILPVRLEIVELPPQVLAFNWIDGAGRSAELVADEIATALHVAGTPVPIPPPLPGDKAPTLANLAGLGFDTRRINGVEVMFPPLDHVPAGEFLMGSDRELDPQAEASETPQFRIPVGAFSIGRYPVTVAEYACAVKAGAVAAPPGSGKDSWAKQQLLPDHPVVMVSWRDAVAYGDWLARVTGLRWRLPSEAEWERAARGSDGRIYPWGRHWESSRANTAERDPRHTTPVGAYAAAGDVSPHGLHDGAGNVWEWTTGLLLPYPYYREKNDDMADRSANRVLRGGSWDSIPRAARAAFRYVLKPTHRDTAVGFRLVCVAGDSW